MGLTAAIGHGVVGETMSLKRSPLFVLPLVAAASTAHAADISPVVVAPVAPVTVGPQMLIQVEGGPVFSSTPITEDPEDKFGAAVGERGFYLGAAVRRMLPSNVGFQAAITGTWLTGFTEGPEVELLTAMRFMTIDLDAGLHPGGDIRTRMFAGIRVLHSLDTLDLYQFGNSPDEAHSVGTAWMFGPRVGANVDRPIGSSNLSFVVDVSASALFGNANVLLDLLADVDASGFRMAFNVEGQLGLAWRPSESFSVAFGYRGQQWWGIRQATEAETFDVYVGVSPNKLIHGPFGRLSLTF
jgi:hypothetical protein